MVKSRPRKVAKRKTTIASTAAAGQTFVPVNDIVEDSDDKAWVLSRHGAIAGRGFHYQDAVAAWLTGRLLTGELRVHRIIPEGLEDISCEGQDSTHVQVKSRQERVGNYRLNEVADFVLDLHRRRNDIGNKTGRLHLVLERGFEGHDPSDWDRRLSADPNNALIAAVRRLADARGVVINDGFFDFVTVIVLPWREAALQTREAIEIHSGVLPAVAEQVVLSVRSTVAAIQDANAEVRRFGSRRYLDSAAIRAVIVRALESVDVESLNGAIRTGICEVLDLDTPMDGESFFEGFDTQPGHIAAGLPAPRPHETSAVIDALQLGRPTLVSGPSGVGKSTVVWASAYSTRHVLWFRVKKLATPADVEMLVRLMKACMATKAAPVGLIVDGVGLASMQAWDELVRQTRGIDYVYLLGSCRTEDLFTVQTLVSCAQVEVELDESTAARIFQHLRDTNRTSAPHWLEAYRFADGLTLEYTFLLTQGQRLTQVIRDQIGRRVRESREVELRIIATVSTAHRWRATVPLAGISSLVGGGASGIRAGLARLVEEHIVIEADGQLSGTHQLRSTELSKCVHTFPPPQLQETMSDLVSIVDLSQLPGLIFHALADEPGLEERVLTSLAERLDLHEDHTATAFEALRTVDFYRIAQNWKAVLERNHVAPALRTITASLALLDSDDASELLRPEVAQSVQEMRGTDPRKSYLRDQLATSLGASRLANLIQNQSTVEGVTDLLTSLAHSGLGIGAEIGPSLDDQFSVMISECTLHQFSELITAAGEVDPSLASALLDASEELATLKDRFQAWSPWLISVGSRRDPDAVVAEARLRHLSDALTGDLHAAAVETARLALRCMPETEKADVKILLAGDHTIKIGDIYTDGESQLLRRYDHTSTQVEWNRRRGAISGSSLFSLAQTHRVASAVVLLQDVDVYLEALIANFVLNRYPSGDEARVSALRRVISERADALVVPVEWDTLGTGNREPSSGVAVDHLHTLSSGIVSNLSLRLTEGVSNWGALCAYVGDTLRKAATEIQSSEPWELVGMVEPPSSLNSISRRLDELWAILAEVAFGSWELSQVRALARVGSYASSATRLASRARVRAAERASSTRDSLERSLSTVGIMTTVRMRDRPDAQAVFWPPMQLAIEVRCSSLVDWVENVDAIVAEILALDGPGVGARERTLVFPSIDGRPVRQVACTVGSTALPDADGSLFSSWAIGPIIPAPLHEAVSLATEALQGLSGIAELGSLRDIADGSEPDVFAREAGARLASAVSMIENLGLGDPVVSGALEYVAEIADQVQAELDDFVAADSCYAADVAAGATGLQSETFETLAGVLMLCLQWDIDPIFANQILAQ